MNGRQFQNIIAEIVYLSTVNGLKIKEKAIYERIRITKNQYAHYKKHPRSKIPDEVDHLLMDYYQQIKQQFDPFDNVMSVNEEDIDHTNDYDSLKQQVRDLQLRLEAERATSAAQAKTIQLLEEKLLQTLHALQQSQAEMLQLLRKKTEE